MIYIILYLLIAFVASTAGAITGMGGGVIIKPVLDMFGHFDIYSISMLSAITVFCMSSVSIFGKRKGGARIDVKMAVPLAIGAVIGGLLGDFVMSSLAAAVAANIVTVVQNTVLALLMVVIFLYMQKKDVLPKLGWTGPVSSTGIGIVLGFCSSFLGIGGGPINVALIIFVFAYGTKEAATCSLVTIWFSQATKIITAWVSGDFSSYDLSMLLPLVIGAVAGGFLGRCLQVKLSEKGVERAFSGMQVVIFLLCVWNVVKNIG